MTNTLAYSLKVIIYKKRCCMASVWAGSFRFHLFWAKIWNFSKLNDQNFKNF